MRSDPLKKGINAAPQRALLKALGLCDAEIERPLIGVVSSQNDIVPGHVFLDKITDAVKQGVALGGGVPIVFPAIAVCDGLAMGHKGMKYSLVSRELIADSVEAMATAHPFDGLVLVAACDKNVPGLLMAAARVNVPPQHPEHRDLGRRDARGPRLRPQTLLLRHLRGREPLSHGPDRCEDLPRA